MNTIILVGAQYLYLVAVAIAIAFLFLTKRKKEMAVFGMIDLVCVFVVGTLTGLFYNNPRPFVSEHITPLLNHAADNGFPSDHVLFVAALASIAFVYNRTVGLAIFGIAVLVGASRVLAGVHHWMDIVGALGIAIAVTITVRAVSGKYLFINLNKKTHEY